jgi:hypothetical protein
MEMADVSDIIDKFNEHGMRLFTDYPTQKHEHCFMVENMIIYLDKKKNSIAVSFLASSKPEVVAQNLLVLKEIEDVDNVFVMESFVYDMNDRFISGEDAHLIVKKSIEHEALKEYTKNQAYTEVLTKASCFEC